ncbi:glucoamylase family protein [Paenibacillus marinisediminis]
MKNESVSTKRILLVCITGMIVLSLVLIPILSQPAESVQSLPKQAALLSGDEEMLEEETRKSFDFFWNEANTDPNSDGYGLIRDRAPGNPSMSSVASIGYGMSAIVIGAERGYITKEQAEERILGTLDTMLTKAEQVNGFFYHFLDMDTAQRFGNSEVSVIDTAIFISGAISAGEYFGEEVKEKAEQLYKNVDWEWYRNKDTNQFYMGYSPENGFSGAWDFYGEQFMLYFLGAASPTHPVNRDMFYDFIRDTASYGQYPPFIHSWFGSIFTHQFSYAWFDLRYKIDDENVNWWDNSVIATKTSRQFSIDQAEQFKTFGPNSWGLTASDGPNGYQGRYGSAPTGFNNDQHLVDGTVPPAGAIGSIVFAPDDVLAAMRHFNSIPELKGQYGFQDSYNLDVTPAYYGEDVIGIDKGISIIMIENYRTGLIWDLMNQNKYIQAGMKMVGLTELGTEVVDDYEGNRNHDGWQMNTSDQVYTLQESNEESYTGLKSMKVEYDKKNAASSYFNVQFDQVDFSDMDELNFNVKGKVKLLVKLEGESGNSIEKKFSSKGDKWNPFVWEFSKEEKAKLGTMNTLIFIAQPGEEQVQGTFYMDDIQFASNRPLGTNPLVEGKVTVGEELTGTYTYIDMNGSPEGKTRYQWLSASDKYGEYTEIAGANASSYTVTAEDKGMHLKVAITPVNREGIEGETLESPANGPVVES